MKTIKVYTVGHSTRTLNQFIEILVKYGIEVVVDVRRFPKSRKFSHFNKENLCRELKNHNIKYFHLPELGGFRDGGYKLFMKTDEFRSGIKKLLEIFSNGQTAIMCTERFFWRCHRKFIADELVRLGYNVIHILNDKVYEHKQKS